MRITNDKNYPAVTFVSGASRHVVCLRVSLTVVIKFKISGGLVVLGRKLIGL